MTAAIVVPEPFIGSGWSNCCSGQCVSGSTLGHRVDQPGRAIQPGAEYWRQPH
jgi:hypothetical protein